MKVLIVDSDAHDRKFLKRAFVQYCDNRDVIEFSTGVDVINYLNDEELPAVIILDVCLPGLDGIKVLERIKFAADWKRVPVVVLADEAPFSTVRKCYDRYANAYHVKPDTDAGYAKLVESICTLWCNEITLAA